MVEVCSLCEGSGLVIVEENGRQVARPCECRIVRRAARMLERARIPKRYEHCSLDNFECGFRGADKSLKSARLMMQRFVEGYVGEHAQRWFYRSWTEWLAARDWADLEATRSPPPTGVI